MTRHPDKRMRAGKRAPSSNRRTASVSFPSWLSLASEVWVSVAAALYVLIFAVISFGFWRVGGYGVETDALGGYLPETQKLLRGEFTTLDGFKGPGYHLVVAAVSIAVRDLFVAAKIVALISAGVLIVLLFGLIRRHLGNAVAALTVLAVATNAQFGLFTVQVGTDMWFLFLAVACAALILGRCTPLRALSAGALAGLAYLTRYNGVFLILSGLVITLLADRDAHGWKVRVVRAGAFLGPVFVVILPWSLFTWSRGMGLFYNTNYLNVAYELYGRDLVTWDQFWEYFNPAFRSFGEVIGADPSGFVAMMLRNGAEHLWLDWRRVLVAGDAAWAAPAAVLWGGMVILGLVVAIRRYRWNAWPPIFLGITTYGVLVPVFYGERFSLPMVPVYGVLAALAVVEVARAKHVPLLGKLAPSMALGLLLWGATATTVTAVRGLLQYSPEEVRLVADAARGSVHKGERILARKPHIAYFLDLEYVRMPIFDRLDDLPRVARENHARYLFVSGIEAALRRPLVPLLDPRNAPPYLKPLAATSGVQAVLYEFTIDIPPMPPQQPAGQRQPQEPLAPQKVRLSRAYLNAGRSDVAYEMLAEAVAAHPNNPEAHRAFGECLVALGRHREAITHLERSHALDSTSVETRAALARAYEAVGDSARAQPLWESLTRETR